MSGKKWYSQVPTNDLEAESKSYGDDDEIGDTYTDTQAEGVEKRYSSTWLSFCVGFAPLVTLLQIYCMFLRSRGLVPSFGDMSHAKTIEHANSLRHPNMYIGLDTVDRDVIRDVLPDNLHVFPHVFQPINRSQPQQVFSFDGRHRITFNGMVSPGEPHVLINKDVSMIMQVRVQDYGLERCSIASIIPNSHELEGQNRILHLGNVSITVELWALDATQGEIEITSLSWSTRPKRTTLISSLVVAEGAHTHSLEFECGTSGSLRIFELACPPGSGSECSIDFWQEQPETQPRMAFTVVQMVSI